MIGIKKTVLIRCHVTLLLTFELRGQTPLTFVLPTPRRRLLLLLLLSSFLSRFSLRNVDMKVKKSTSLLQRILVSCGAQAKEYGGCVASKIPEVERDMCLKEFLALKNCMQNINLIEGDREGP
ncbi:hypothetical protein AKJ16_DCAP13906 [Drosera capensis]